MAKKFGKFLFFTAAIGTACAAAYYYLKKKDNKSDLPEDDDYDDFSNDEAKETDSSRNYVPLTQDTFTPLKETLSPEENKTEETVEEFFDEDDSSDEEPPIEDN